jgi:hypothetical protein
MMAHGVMQGELGHVVQVRRGYALEEGNWRRRVEMVKPVAGWQGKYDDISGSPFRGTN